MAKKNAEAARLESKWKKWGPYVSERQWGTVREDYSDNGNAWEYFTHDQARSVPISGAKTGLPASRMINSGSALLWLFGMVKIPS